MMLERLRLHNVGVYKGEHELELSTSADRPVVLIGALNGSGKTTLLETVQLALFGRAARGLNRGRVGYSNYLEQLINRDVDPETGAAVGLKFSRRHGGRDEMFEIVRTWSKTGATIKENIEVIRDDVIDMEATERWLEFVENFLPIELSELFLFDGERIEALADPDRSSAFLRSGVTALLGLDLVDHLTRSLTKLERRKQSARPETAQLREAVARAEEERDEAIAKRRELRDKRASHQTASEQAQKTLESARLRLSKEGGDLFARREHIAEQLRLAESTAGASGNALRELLSGDAPLLLVADLLDDASVLAERAVAVTSGTRIFEAIVEHDKEILWFIKKQQIGSSAKQKIATYIEQSRQKWSTNPKHHELSGLTNEGFDAINPTYRAELKAQMRSAHMSYCEAAEAATTLRATLLSIPARESIQINLDEVNEAELELAACNAAMEAIDIRLDEVAREIDRAETRVKAAAHVLNQALLEDRDEQRLITHSTRSKETLGRFRELVVSKNVRRLEELVAGRFKTLLRKGDALIASVGIDPESFSLVLRDGQGRTIDPVVLSAGERQLLAVAIVWGLASASGRALPTIIDTPLGRLDGEHRRNLVQNYFPAASRQVILLSTDEEINGRYYRQLQPHIAREYLLQFNSKTKSSTVSSGYFEQAKRSVA